jgi:hypothetical protein
MEASYVSLPDLIIAYRKAKVDAFYETGHNTRYAFAVYEDNLIENLTYLRDKINSEDLEWFTDDSFIGEHIFTIKKITPKYYKKSQTKESAFLYFSDTQKSWENLESANVEYRIIGKHHVHFHVLSSLWIEKVGYNLDEHISESSYGCRLKQSKKKNIINDNSRSNINTQNSYGHFNSYLSGYQKWQYNGLENISQALSKGKNILAVTADLKKYYHRIDPSFILEKKFLEEIGYSGFTPLQSILNNILISAITAWSKSVYIDNQVPSVFKYKGHAGIPMGLSASKVIANLLLTSLDRDIENELRPIYYGRYVDDFFIVIENNDTIQNEKDFRKYLKRRINKLKSPVRSKRDIEGQYEEYKPQDLCYQLEYSKNSLIEFGEEKERYFFLEGLSGETFLNTLKESLDENSSEWNLPPDTETDIEKFSEEIANATSDHKELANSLRKSDGVSIQRMKFVLYLKRFEKATTYLPKTNWENQVRKYFSIALENIITPESLPVYIKYIPSLISLAIKTENYDVLLILSKKIDYAFEKINQLQSTNHDQLHSARIYLNELLYEGAIVSINPIYKKKSINKENEIFQEIFDSSYFEAYEKSVKLYLTDLHQIPFKECFVTPDKRLKESIESHSTNLYLEVKQDYNFDSLPFYDIFLQFSRLIWRLKYAKKGEKDNSPFALYFYTRPFTLSELCFIFPQWYERLDSFRKFCLLYHIEWFEPLVEPDEAEIINNDLVSISIKSENESNNRVFAFTSLKTSNKSWVAVVREDGSEPDNTRRQRLLNLVGDIILAKKRDCRIDYVLFPELSIPRNMLLYIASLFLRKKISLITGVDYEILNPRRARRSPNQIKFVSNQLHYFLTIPGKHYSQHVNLMQEKIIPAQKEERELFDVGGAIMRVKNRNKFLINHGNFWFTGLICNDILDINTRAKLRGVVDALIIVEWNRDIETYNALVESSANDLHTFILQVNNRLYGDTRLRAPYKESYMRDVVRVRGGDLDYFVVATLEVDELREFQRNHRSPEKPFKPVPTGFMMSEARRRK